MKIGPITTFKTRTGDTFRRRKMVLDLQRYDPVTGKPSPKKSTPEFTLTGGAIGAIEGFHEGETVRVHFLINGSSFTSSVGDTIYVNELRAYRIESLDRPDVSNGYGPEDCNY
jgi:hypothetical protein